MADPDAKHRTPRLNTRFALNRSPSQPPEKNTDRNGDAVGVKDPSKFVDRKSQVRLYFRKQQRDQREFHHKGNTDGDGPNDYSAG